MLAAGQARAGIVGGDRDVGALACVLEGDGRRARVGIKQEAVAMLLIGEVCRTGAIEELFRVCRLRGEVKVGSSGFMSGGMRAMRRNIQARYKEMARETTCRPPAAIRP